ncbi:MAG: serine/threonine protein kinase [Candidatus Xenobiia bacterium LiM19]
MGKLRPGAVLEGKYRVRRLLGEGGMNRVYLVEDLAGTKKWALKLTKNTADIQSTQQDQYNKFLKEVAILTTLRHPNLPVIEDYFPYGSQYCIVEEYIEGESLDEHVKHNLPSEADVLGWAITVCDVLQLLHKNDIIFRDLKPGNLILTKTGTIKMIDFGIARYYKHGKAVDTELLGTPGYAAPETYGRAQSDARSDIYSLGATMHHLLSGVDPQDKPFHFEPLSKLRPGISVAASSMIMRMVEAKPHDRYATVTEVRRQIESARSVLSSSRRGSSYSSAAGAASLAPPASAPPQSSSKQLIQSFFRIIFAVIGTLVVIGWIINALTSFLFFPAPSETPYKTKAAAPSRPVPTVTPSAEPIKLDEYGDFGAFDVPIAYSTPDFEGITDRGYWSEPLGGVNTIYPPTYITYPTKMTDPQIELSSNVVRPGGYLDIKFAFKVHYHTTYSRDPWTHDIRIFFALPVDGDYTTRFGRFFMIPGTVSHYRLFADDPASGDSSKVSIPVTKDEHYVKGSLRWKPSENLPPIKYDAVNRWKGPRVILYVSNNNYHWEYTKGFIIGAKKK